MQNWLHGNYSAHVLIRKCTQRNIETHQCVSFKVYRSPFIDNIMLWHQRQYLLDRHQSQYFYTIHIKNKGAYRRHCFKCCGRFTKVNKPTYTNHHWKKINLKAYIREVNMSTSLWQDQDQDSKPSCYQLTPSTTASDVVCQHQVLHWNGLSTVFQTSIL